MSNLADQACSACEIGAPLVPKKEQIVLLENLDEWEIDHAAIQKLVKAYSFKTYKQASHFSNLVAELAELEDHHPKITLEWGIVTIEWWSHKIKGLHINDFICAAKSDALFRSL